MPGMISHQYVLCSLGPTPGCAENQGPPMMPATVSTNPVTAPRPGPRPPAGVRAEGVGAERGGSACNTAGGGADAGGV